MSPFDENLRPFATDSQWEAYCAYHECESLTAAARKVGMDTNNLRRSVRRLEARAARGGYAPAHGLIAPYPDTYYMGKVTVQRGPGGVERVWDRMLPDLALQEQMMKEAAEAFVAEMPAAKVPKYSIKHPDKDIIPWFQIGDAHLGMMAWMRETGHNFDLAIGATELGAAFEMLLERCEPGERCVINDLGDGTHYENFKAETEQSGFKLDADGRFPKMIEVWARILRELVDRALAKFKYVDVILNQGNHSRTNDIWMAVLVKSVYGHTGRVHVVPNESVFIPYLMGKTFVLTHHSDKASGKRLADVMLNDYREALRQAEFFYIDTGHVHHHYTSKEYGLIKIESWNNLAPNDKHHHDRGYRSKQSMSVVLRSRSYGEIGRWTMPIQMVWDRLSKAAGTVETSMPDRKIYSV